MSTPISPAAATAVAMPAACKHRCAASNIMGAAALPINMAATRNSKQRKCKGTKTAERLAENTLPATALSSAPPNISASATSAQDSNIHNSATPARRELPDHKQQEHPGKPDLPHHKQISVEVKVQYEEQLWQEQRIWELASLHMKEVEENEQLDGIREHNKRTLVVLTLEDALNPPPDSDDLDPDLPDKIFQIMIRVNNKATLAKVAKADVGVEVDAGTNKDKGKASSNKGKKKNAKSASSKAAKATMLKRGQCNDIITIDSDTTVFSTTIKKAPRPTTAATAATAVKAKKALKTTKAPIHTPHTSSGGACAAVKTQPITNPRPLIKTEPGLKSVPSVRKPVPVNILAYWPSAIRPTVYAKFSNTLNPWFIFMKIAANVPELQAIVDIVVLGLGYTVEFRNKLFDNAVDCLYQKQSKIGCATLAHVASFYSAPPYKDNPAAIRDHTIWALHADGPGFWQHPMPMEQTQRSSHENPQYQKLKGYLCSEFINSIMQLMVQRMASSYILYYEPRGAVVLAMIAVERVFEKYRLGTSNDTIMTFSFKNYKQATVDYGKAVSNIKVNHWLECFMAWGFDNGSRDAPASTATLVASSSLQHACRFLMPSSSPALEELDEDEDEDEDEEEGDE
ncbi:hypothetical protein CONPUDRAFT_151164 [Coniophora puteana RWD-64-598 SS2]|uniref:Uncharacterized protein n=1 Tax=Coniophora puteana (strain RWD-64-598) TaxID=741705 RepID=A0A5M3MYB4_CONPW|nr:uncharacterized protein CONPUDRAFT_151164 [Coniophora puteana RWD-64-598 SS2]EIW84120.1 hypothetical protein CONPUDRAFT_151164 [Coniophora puteana RWD-64-598 SS2]